MLKSLFKRKPSVDDPNPSVRKEVVQRSKDLSHDEFVEIARTDTDWEIRKSALARANSIDLYTEFLDHEQLGNFCRSQIAQKIDAKHHLAHDPRILPLRLSKETDPQKLFSVLTSVEPPTDQAKAIVGLSGRELRLDVTGLIHNHRVLVELEKLSRTKDKSLNRLVRRKLNESKTIEQTRQETVERAERAIESAQRLRASHPHYDAQRTTAEKDWEVIRNDIRALNTKLKTYQKKPIGLESLEQRFPKRETFEQTDQQQQPQFEAILKQLRDCSLSEGAIADCEQAWLSALKMESAPKLIADQFYHLANSKRRELKALESQNIERTEIEKLTKPIVFRDPDSKSGSWRHVWKTQSVAKARLRDVQRYLKKLHARPKTDYTENAVQLLTAMENSLTHEVLERISELQKDIVVQIESNFSSLTKFIESGELRRAQSAERNIAAMIHRLPRPAQGKYKSQLTPISAEIKQLFGWQQFVESPKRQVLCEEVESLVENPMVPQEQFNRIRDLRESWNQLGPARSREDREFQNRYETAAAAAFQVCEKWFQQLAAVREKNLAERTSICEALESFLAEYDWDHPDWKAVNTTIRTAQSEWRKFVPVDKRYSKKINNRFRQITGELERLLEANWIARAEEKQALIDEVKAALADENSSVGDLINFVKKAQEKWRTIGSAGNQREQPLWEDFRQSCNEAFDLLTTQREQRRSVIGKSVEEGERLVNDLAAQVSSEDASLRDLDLSAINQVRTKIAQLDLPQRVQGRLGDRLREITKQLKEKAAKLETEQNTSTLRKLLALDNEIAKLEHEEQEVSDQLLETVPGAQKLFRIRSAEVAEKSTIEIHELVLRAEVLADVPSPPEDSGKRMQVQVARLKHGFTHGGDVNEQRVENLIQEWCKFAFGEQQLRPRFHAAINKHLDSLVP